MDITIFLLGYIHSHDILTYDSLSLQGSLSQSLQSIACWPSRTAGERQYTVQPLEEDTVRRSLCCRRQDQHLCMCVYINGQTLPGTHLLQSLFMMNVLEGCKFLLWCSQKSPDSTPVWFKPLLPACLPFSLCKDFWYVRAKLLASRLKFPSASYWGW